MKIECHARVDLEGAARTFEAESFAARSVSPHHHEVVLSGVTADSMSPAGNFFKRSEMLIEICGDDRQQTGPLRFARVIITDGDMVVYDKDTAGSAGVEPSASTPEVLEAPLEVRQGANKKWAVYRGDEKLSDDMSKKEAEAELLKLDVPVADEQDDSAEDLTDYTDDELRKLCVEREVVFSEPGDPTREQMIEKLQRP